MVEPPAYGPEYDWLWVVKYVGYALSILILIIFIDENQSNENSQDQNRQGIANVFNNPKPIILWTVSWWLDHFSK